MRIVHGARQPASSAADPSGGRRGNRLGQAEGILHEPQHALPPAFGHGLQTAELEPGEADPARGAHDLEAEVGQEVLGEDGAVDPEALAGRLALPVAEREGLERPGATVAGLADRREEERLQHPLP